MERVEKHVESIGGVSLLTQAAVRWRQQAKHTEVSWRQKVFCFFFRETADKQELFFSH